MKPQYSHRTNDGDPNRPHSSDRSGKYAGLTRNQINSRKYREKTRRPKEAMSEGGAGISGHSHGGNKVGDIKANTSKSGHGQSSATSSKSGHSAHPGVKSHVIDKAYRQADHRPLRERNWKELTRNQRNSLKSRQKYRKPKEDEATSERKNTVKEAVRENSGSNYQDRF